MAGRGISEAEWKAATASYNTEPITYDCVHGLAPGMIPGEVIDWDEAMRDLMGGREYETLTRKIFGSDGPEPVAEQASEKKEAAENGPQDAMPADDPFFEGFPEDLAETFEDPIVSFQSACQALDDELSLAASYWEEMDVDNRAYIDLAIHFAEVML